MVELLYFEHLSFIIFSFWQVAISGTLSPNMGPWTFPLVTKMKTTHFWTKTFQHLLKVCCSNWNQCWAPLRFMVLTKNNYWNFKTYQDYFLFFLDFLQTKFQVFSSSYKMIQGLVRTNVDNNTHDSPWLLHVP